MSEYSVKLLMHLIIEIRQRARRRHIQKHLFPVDVVPQIHCRFNLQNKEKTQTGGTCRNIQRIIRRIKEVHKLALWAKERLMK